MNENGMKVLTQEEFDNTVRATRFNKYYKKDVAFERMIVDIDVDYPAATYIFNNCKIVRIKDLTAGVSFRPTFLFTSCEIVDYRNIIDSVSLRSFDDCIFTIPVPLACPSEGAFIGWKKCLLYGGSAVSDVCLVKLLIPEDAKRSSAFGTKCRCSKAKVLGIYSSVTDNELDDRMACSSWDKTYYKKHEWVYPDSFDENRYRACSNGIHFFMDKEEARRYPI